MRSDSHFISSLPTGQVSNDPPGRVHRDLRSFAPVPFWSWNEQMHPDEVDEQTRQIARGGWAGAFIHARMGLTINYLGDAWFRAVDRAMSSAGENGLNVWLYDEDTWPSGFSGGTVPARELTAWSVERLDDNALVLDRAHWREADGPWSAKALPIIAIQRRLNELAFDGPLSLRFELQVAEPPSTSGMRLVVEYPERAEIRVNGVLLRYGGLPYWKDIRWLPIEIGAHLRAGTNEITVHYPAFRAGRLSSPDDAAARSRRPAASSEK